MLSFQKERPCVYTCWRILEDEEINHCNIFWSHPKIQLLTEGNDRRYSLVSQWLQPEKLTAPLRNDLYRKDGENERGFCFGLLFHEAFPKSMTSFPLKMLYVWNKFFKFAPLIMN